MSDSNTNGDTMSRADVAQLMNNTGLMEKVGQLRGMLVNHMIRELKSNEPKEYTQRDTDTFILNSVGPAAASAAVSYAITQTKDKFSTLTFNSSAIHNHQLITKHKAPTANDDGYPNYSNVLRQFLLPRYAYLDFDTIVDPRHQIDLECGYPKFITPIMYRYLYDRDDVASRVVDIYPDETWAANPEIYEDEDEDTLTDFEEDVQRLCDDHDLLQYLYRIDKQAGIGHYGALLMGVNDGKSLEEPIDEEDLLKGMKRSVGKTKRDILYLRPFDEYLSFIQSYETNENSPRYGLPLMYNLVFVDMTIDAAGAAIGTRLNRRVHWTRVNHIADNEQGSLVFGKPRQQAVFNRLLDLRKLKGGSAEMFWKGAFPGLAFEIDPRFVADEPEFDRDAFRRTIENYSNGLQRYLDLVGITAKSLAPQVADPKSHVMVQIMAISMHLNVPSRIFMGSEEGRLASSQDKLTWNQRLNRRLLRFVEPGLIRKVIDRFIAIGVIRSPKKGKYFITWPDLNTPTDEDKANLSLKWTQAISQYVASGMIHLIKPMDYLTMIVGMRPSQAKRVIADVESRGGWAKLMAVDPSKGTGQNGVRTADANKKDSGTTRSRPSKRDKNTKKNEGKTS